MTPKKRRQWARVFLNAKRHGLGRLKLILFSVACARNVGSLVPFFMAVRVVRRVAPTRSPAWQLPPMWAPRALGVLAVGIATWGILTLSANWTPNVTPELDVEDSEVPEWFFTGQGDAGVVAKKMPSTRMKGQQAPPCGSAPLQFVINDACWIRADGPAPCGDIYEHEGRCYIPVVEKKRTPTGVDE
jgi:hypothetical protein